MTEQVQQPTNEQVASAMLQRDCLDLYWDMKEENLSIAELSERDGVDQFTIEIMLAMADLALKK